MITLKQNCPSGTRLVGITLDGATESQAQLFEAAGGWLECEIIASGRVSLTACTTSGDIWLEVCPNGPEVPQRIKALVAGALDRIRVEE